MASSLGAVVAGVAPDETAPAEPVLPTACADWSRTVASETDESPEYSSAVMPISAPEVGVTVIDGSELEPVGTGALHTLCSVPSPATKCSSSVNLSPAESVTLLVVALPSLHTPAS